MKGKLITFEGLDGVGKTTVINSLSEILKEELGDKLITTFTPGSTNIGKKIKKIILESDKDILPEEIKTSLFLYDHINHTQEVLIPALESGKIILCDRYIDSFIAYQRFGYNINLDFLSLINFPSPAKTFLLEVPIEELSRRLLKRSLNKENNWMDSMDIEFYSRIELGYKWLANENPNRIETINANVSFDSLLNILLNILLKEIKIL
jgi:dTMP kinase